MWFNWIDCLYGLQSEYFNGWFVITRCTIHWKWYRWYVTLIEWEEVVQFHFLLTIVSEHFDHTELVCWWNWSMQLITHVFYCQLEFEFIIQVYDITIHILKHKHQSIKSVNHRYTNVRHRSTIVGRWIINDHCGEQVIVLIGNLHIGGSYQWWIHLDHLTISSDINHIRSSNPRISRISGALLKSIEYGDWIQMHP